MDELVFLPYVRVINCLSHPLRCSDSSFSSLYFLLFLKSSRSCILLLPPPFPFINCHLIYSQNMSNPVAFSKQDIIQNNYLLSYMFKHFISYFLSTFLSLPFSSSTTFRISRNLSIVANMFVYCDLIYNETNFKVSQFSVYPIIQVFIYDIDKDDQIFNRILQRVGTNQYVVCSIKFMNVRTHYYFVNAEVFESEGGKIKDNPLIEISLTSLTSIHYCTNLQIQHRRTRKQILLFSNAL